MTQIVMDYLADRRQKWLDKQLNSSMTEDEQLALTTEANIKFSLVQWLPDAARRAKQLPMMTHPSKFTHSSAKASPVVFESGRARADGYVRSGNVSLTNQFDASGNAAAMDVYSLLCLKLSDEHTLLQHLEARSDKAKALLQQMSADAEEQEETCKLLLKIKSNDSEAMTDHLVKQVYFPVQTNYHLLSILTASGIVFEMKSRIDAKRFSDESKAAREARKNGENHAEGFADILNLTVFGYGGSKPQTVSVLNNQNRGRTYLLASTPPTLHHRKTRLPARDFFEQNLRQRDFQDYLKTLFGLMSRDYNNAKIRQAIKTVLHKIVDEVVYRAYCVRAQKAGWSFEEYYRKLPKAQRIWLDAGRVAEREDPEQWLDAITEQLKKWLVSLIESDKTIKLGDAEIQFLIEIIQTVLAQDKEYF